MPSFVLYFSLFQNRRLRNLSLIPQPPDLIRVDRNTINPEYIYSRVFLMTHIVSCCSSIVTYGNFLSMTYIFMHVIRNGKTFHLLCIFDHHDLAMLCFYLTFIAQYSAILLSSLLHPCAAAQFTC